MVVGPNEAVDPKVENSTEECRAVAGLDGGACPTVCDHPGAKGRHTAVAKTKREARIATKSPPCETVLLGNQPPGRSGYHSTKDRTTGVRVNPHVPRAVRASMAIGLIRIAAQGSGRMQGRRAAQGRDCEGIRSLRRPRIPANLTSGDVDMCVSRPGLQQSR